jgi:hypothetical protein
MCPSVWDDFHRPRAPVTLPKFKCMAKILPPADDDFSHNVEETKLVEAPGHDCKGTRCGPTGPLQRKPLA